MFLIAEPLTTHFNASDTNGEVSNRISYLYNWMFWVSMVVFVFTVALILFAAIRYRRRFDDEEEPRQVHGNNRLETAWTALPFIILVALFFLTLTNLGFVQTVQGANVSSRAMHVNVNGAQFAWTYTYQDVKRSNGKNLTVIQGAQDPVKGSTAPFVVPVGVPVDLTVTSSDVIHSYYLPSLAGQINAVPGQTNHMWFQANEPGAYFGACTELCGKGHASMEIQVDALVQKDYDTWLKQQTSK